MTDINEAIKKDISDNKVFLYMKGNPAAPQCGFSAKVCEILNGLDVKFATKDVLENPEVREGVKAFSNWPTIPQLYVDGKFVGGCDIIVQMSDNGELKKLVGS